MKQYLPFDPRVHSRLIGRRGCNTCQVMGQYKVEIRFVAASSNLNMITVIDLEDKVEECEGYLINFFKEYVSFHMGSILLLI